MKSTRRAALAALGLGLSIAAVVVLLRHVSAKELLRNIGRADPAWLLGACVVTVIGYFFRAWRWAEILSPEAKVPFGRVFAATMVGFLAINTLPARLGEFVRAYVLARSERLKTATVLGSVVIERVFDLAALGTFWALSLLFAPYPAWLKWSGYMTVALGLLTTIAIWLLHAGHYAPISLGARLGAALPRRLSSLVSPPVSAFTSGLRAFGRPATLVRAGGLSTAMWIVNALVFLMVGTSMGLPLPLWAPRLLSFVVCVAILVPSSPGFVGVMEGSCVVGLSLVGIDPSRALAYGVLYHVTQLLPVVLLGGYYAVRGRSVTDLAAAGAGAGKTPGSEKSGDSDRLKAVTAKGVKLF